jgi:cupin fold WbuC family metalloprotein
MKIDKELLDKLFEQAKDNLRLRTNLDMRTSNEDGSQMMLNAMMPGTEVAIHRHPNSVENVLLLTGRIDEVLYEEVSEFQKASRNLNDERFQDSMDVARKVTLREVERIHLCSVEGKFGCQVPKGVWHTVEVIEPSVIFEGKDGRYGEDGSETF